jgi:hypothetical protein
MPDLASLLRPPYLFLILGIISILAAVVFTCTGKVWVRFNGWLYRAKEPGWFCIQPMRGSSDRMFPHRERVRSMLVAPAPWRSLLNSYTSAGD